MTPIMISEYNYDFPWSDLIDKALRLAHERYGDPMGEGRHRMVFRDGDFVVKVPKKESGVYACFQEIAQQGDRYAKTWKDPLSEEVAPLIIVRMEYVVHLGYSETIDWTWSIDMGQVGCTSDGRLVAYDWERVI